MTEPCDVTIGGATWLDQAQETAARTNQNAGPHRRKAGVRGGIRELHQLSQGGRQGPYRIGEATDSCRSTQEGGGARPKNCPPIAKIIHTGPERKRRCRERHGTAERKGRSKDNSHNQLQGHLQSS